jgi:hypothetical protein
LQLVLIVGLPSNQQRSRAFGSTHFTSPLVCAANSPFCLMCPQVGAVFLVAMLR